MHDFILRELKNTDLKKELLNIGFDKSYSGKAVEKYEYKNIKIYSLSCAQANIIKQTALSVGADCATQKGVITGKIEKSNCILTGSISEINKIAEKLKIQPFNLKELGLQLEKYCKVNNEGRSSIQFSPKIAGILNITDNSFSDGGLYNSFEKAIQHLEEMVKDGADIIDIGAESTKPYSSPIDDKTQLEKLLPIIDYAKGKITISIDTRSSIVAKECIQAGANLINDVSGFDYDKNMINIISQCNVPIIIQHSKGTPDTMQNSPQYYDIMEEIFLKLKQKTDYAKSKGIENIIIDPGIGFGKTRENNFEIIKRLEELKSLGYPIMLGISRKNLLGMPDEDNQTKDIFTTALNAIAIEHKVDYIRVHNVKMHKKLIDLMKMFMIK